MQVRRLLLGGRSAALPSSADWSALVGAVGYAGFDAQLLAAKTGPGGDSLTSFACHTSILSFAIGYVAGETSRVLIFTI